MKRILIFSILLFSATQLLGQTQPNKRLAEAVKIDYGFKLPFSTLSPIPTNGIRISYFICSDYPLKMIKDTSGKDYSIADDTYVYASFKVKDNDIWLCVCNIEMGPCYCSKVLLLIDSEGKVWDELYVYFSNDNLKPKDFKIDSDMNIVVYCIEPTHADTIKLWEEECEFIGYRQDCTYRIQDKKFVLVSTKRGPDRLIKSSDFQKEGHYHLWEPFWAI